MVSCDRRNGKMILSSVTNVRACEPEPEPRAYFASHCVCFLFLFLFFSFLSFNLRLIPLLSIKMLHLAAETKVFDFLSCVKFRASSFSVCIKFNFIERMLTVNLWFQIQMKFEFP